MSNHIDLSPPTAPELTGAEPLFIVRNCGSGNHRHEDFERTLSRLLSDAGRRFEILSVSQGQGLLDSAKEAVKKARTQSGIVVAAGGDGTLNTVAQAVLGRGVPMGILPQGTFNYFGRNLGISQDIELAVKALLDAKIHPVQVGLVNGRVFLVNASLGLYPQLLEDREAYKQRFGRSRGVALGSAVVTLFRAHRQLNMEIHVGGKTRHLRSPSLLVGNNELQLEQVGIDEFAELRRDQLVAVAPRPISTLALYGLLLRGLAGLLGDAEHISSFGFKEMTVRLGKRHKRIKVAMDGEIFWMRSPLEFKVAEQKLPLLVPANAKLRERA